MMMQPVLERARREPDFFQTLKGLRTIMYGGTSLAPEIELWAHESGLNMAVSFRFYEYRDVSADENGLEHICQL